MLHFLSSSASAFFHSFLSSLSFLPTPAFFITFFRHVSFMLFRHACQHFAFIPPFAATADSLDFIFFANISRCRRSFSPRFLQRFSHFDISLAIAIISLLPLIHYHLRFRHFIDYFHFWLLSC
jgi:hypothetical protein